MLLTMIMCVDVLPPGGCVEAAAGSKNTSTDISSNIITATPLVQSLEASGLLAGGGLSAANMTSLQAMRAVMEKWRNRFFSMRANSVSATQKLKQVTMDDLIDFCHTPGVQNTQQQELEPQIFGVVGGGEVSTPAASSTPPHVLYNWIFHDGLGHSLMSFLRVLLIVMANNCTSSMALPPDRFDVSRNFVFVPWWTANGDPFQRARKWQLLVVRCRVCSYSCCGGGD